MRRICYDTEFLEQAPYRRFGYDRPFVGREIDLISIGLVDDAGREYYGINAEAPWHEITEHPWLRENVLPYLPGEVLPFGNPRRGRWRFDRDADHPDYKHPRQLAREVHEFIKLLEPGYEDLPHPPEVQPELWAYYGAYDHVVMMGLWGNMLDRPKVVPMYTHDLMQEWHRLGGHPELKPPHADDEHHALADARWNMHFLRNLRSALARV